MLQITSTNIGSAVHDPIYLLTLSNNDITINLTNYGCTITSIFTACRKGVKKNIVAGYADMTSYTDNPHYFGCVLGRYAGRIAGSAYSFDGEVIKLSPNEGPNHLHGGFDGFNKKIWKIKSLIQTEEKVGVIMEYLSPDGEEGYPGNLWVTIKITLNQSNQLEIAYHATTDKSTPVSLSNHSYFNLTGFEDDDILDHNLYVNARYFTEKDEENLPTGNILPLCSTPLDFQHKKKIGQDIGDLKSDEGYNFNYVLAKNAPEEFAFAAELIDEHSGRGLKIYTDQPTLQLYTANTWDGALGGQQGQHYKKHGAVALETQAFPDAPNQHSFPNSILHPQNEYRTRTVYEFTTD
jgi:aldose 1-epimerase